MSTHEAVVFLIEGFEEIEAITTIDILRRAGIKTASVSLTGKYEVFGSRSITVMADKIFDDLKDVKGTMLILPGGPGTANYKKHEILLELLKMHNNNGEHIAAICAAPTILGMLGLLKDKTAVCYPSLEAELNAKEIGMASVVTDGNITTSRGPATSTDFALEIVRIIKGLESAGAVAEALLYAG